MATISKEKANMLAKHLCRKQNEKINKMEIEFINICDKFIENHIPTQVKECFNAYPEYFATRKSVCINSAFEAYFSKPQPLTSWYLNTSSDKSHEMEKHKDDLNKLKIKYNQNVRTIADCIFQLRTDKKVLAEFPELVAEIGAKQTLALSIPVKDVKAILFEINR